jgi:hypothetical protein
MPPSGTATRPDRRSGFRRSLQMVGDGEGPQSNCVCFMQEDVPVRLRPSDLQNPEEFHRRLAQFLMEQR